MFMSSKPNYFDSSTELSEGAQEVVDALIKQGSDFKDFLATQAMKPSALTIFANIVLGVLTSGFVHAIYYLGCLIARGADMQKWEDKDPITWFFNKVHGKGDGYEAVPAEDEDERPTVFEAL